MRRGCAAFAANPLVVVPFQAASAARKRRSSTWRPTIPTSASPDDLAEAGVGLPPDGPGTYGYGYHDVHPELSTKWACNGVEDGGLLPGWDNPERRLTSRGFYADVENEAVQHGMEYTPHARWRRDYTPKGHLTQGGKGLSTSEFQFVYGMRALMKGTHQFMLQMQSLDPGKWHATKWNENFSSLRRDFWFSSRRMPVLLYNRLIDRVRACQVHMVPELELIGGSCVVHLCTTWAQGVTLFDFELARFLDKEYRLMWRSDWAPVVVKRDEEGRPINFVIRNPVPEELPEGVVMGKPDDVVPAQELDGLIARMSAEWSLQPARSHTGAAIAVHMDLKSVYRAMDVVNRVWERCEELGRPWDAVSVLVSKGRFSFGLAEGITWRDACLMVYTDSLVSSHAENLTSQWSRDRQCGVGGDIVSRLADGREAPRSWFLKNPLGEGTGPIRKVRYEMPADLDKAYRKAGMGRPPLPEETIQGLRYHVPVAMIDTRRNPNPTPEQVEEALQKDARKKGLEGTKNPSVPLEKLPEMLRKVRQREAAAVPLDQLPEIVRRGVQKKERLGTVPTLE